MGIGTIGPAGRAPGLVEELVAVWESAVRATHDFLANDEVERIKAYVGPAAGQVERLVVAFDEKGGPYPLLYMKPQD
ncbi:hypothetical protein AAK967_05575 [Atopobiaceae bacterium 24-176]